MSGKSNGKAPELSPKMIEVINRLLGEGKRLEIAAKPDGIHIWEIKSKKIET